MGQLQMRYSCKVLSAGAFRIVDIGTLCCYDRVNEMIAVLKEDS